MVIEELTTRLGFQVDPNGLDKGKQALGSFKKWAAGIGIAAGAAFAYFAKVLFNQVSLTTHLLYHGYRILSSVFGRIFLRNFIRIQMTHTLSIFAHSFVRNLVVVATHSVTLFDALK